MALESVRDLAKRASVQDTSLAPIESEFVSALIPDILKKMKQFGIRILLFYHVQYFPLIQRKKHQMFQLHQPRHLTGTQEQILWTLITFNTRTKLLKR